MISVVYRVEIVEIKVTHHVNILFSTYRIELQAQSSTNPPPMIDEVYTSFLSISYLFFIVYSISHCKYMQSPLGIIFFIQTFLEDYTLQLNEEVSSIVD